ncbi:MULTISPECIES: acyl-homoserine-lactone synthase [Ruegeria]|uniref:Acyl-homoserine-lactone synthase n=1 Tax=Ruegeria atlantica TaxID=81569 RepID=A0AA91BS62_9RHOB|nr:MULTISPECIES: acyl-homoserine-lactone synthase [Ruegeria]NOC82773.1 autoinducer synthase [Ruegeria sp. HKCCD6428]NOD95755.1 autoinducer synthase [Ruegeria sp. HKCCD6228]NOE16738.1 autoinducer synthase [Ruegeria atlantica]NOE25567.1 autoinducer synthase [Ruegeria sp. HKCCD6157]QFT73285.1 Acyl-homoserine-lactone synthase [Ruegeria sp. THAF33]
MIIVVDGLNRHMFSEVLDEMFELRARVFGERLGWDVNIEDGKEIDEFDHLDPAYVIGLDDEGNVVAAVRALQTTGPHMLSDVFSAILCGEAPLRSATMWESTRFCVDTQRLTRGKEKNSVSYATCELMIGSLEYAKNAGIQDIITVIDPVMDRVLKRSNCAPYDYVGKTVPMGKVHALAALLDCTEERIAGLREFAGIHNDVFMDEEEALALFAAKKAAAQNPANQDHKPLTDLEKYFVEQMSAAKTEAERQDVLKLIEALTDTFTPEQRTALLETPRAFAHEA